MSLAKNSHGEPIAKGPSLLRGMAMGAEQPGTRQMKP